MQWVAERQARHKSVVQRAEPRMRGRTVRLHADLLLLVRRLQLLLLRYAQRVPLWLSV